MHAHFEAGGNAFLVTTMFAIEFDSFGQIKAEQE